MRKSYFPSIRTSLILLVLLALLPALSIIISSGLNERAGLIADAKRTALGIAVSQGQIQERMTENARQVLTVLSTLPEVQRMDAAACQEILARVHRLNPQYSSIALLDAAGGLLASSHPLRTDNLRDRKHFQDALATKAFSAGEFILSRFTQEPIFPYCLPLLDDNGAVKGVLQANIALGTYSAYIEKLELPPGGIITLLDYKGIRLMVYPPKPTNPVGSKVGEDLWEAMTASGDEGIAVRTGADAVRRIYAFKKLRLTPGSPPYMLIAIGLAEHEVEAAATEALSRNLMRLAMAAMLAMGIAWFFGDMVVARRLRVVAETAGRIGGGDLAARTGVAYDTSELGVVAQTVDGMAATLLERERERAEAETLLRQSEERFRATFEQAAVGIAHAAIDGRWLLVNDRLCAIAGYTREELLARTFQDITHPDDLQADMEQRGRLLAGEIQTYGREKRYIRKDGSLVWINLTVSLKRDQAGTPRYVIAVVEDISQRKAAEQELAHIRRFIQSILDSMPSVVAGVDREERITHWSRTAAALTGLGWQQARGQSLPKAFPFMEPHMDAVGTVLSRGEVLSRAKLPVVVEGHTRQMDMLIYPLLDKEQGGGVQGAVIRFDDVSDRAHLEEMLAQTEKLVSLGGLTAGMAHEINNPLAGILLNAQNMERRLSEDMAANRKTAEACGVPLDGVRCYLEGRDIFPLLENILASGRRAARMVENMLEFSQHSDSRRSLTDIHAVLDRAVKLAETDYDLKTHCDFGSIEVVRDYAPDLPPVPCSALEIEQVVLGLLKNAAQAMATRLDTMKPRRITVRTRLQSGFAQLEVTDNGPGMEERVRRKVFDPFFTTRPTGPDRSPGLGLAIAYFIISSRHGGTIAVESAPGQGTRFIIRLPLDAAPDAGGPEPLSGR